MENIVIYNSKKYWLSKTNPKYYYADFYINGKRKKIGLHQKVFIDNYGPIPEYHDIHHLDGNTFNNDKNNLKAIERGKHRSEHIKNRLSNPENYAKNYEHLMSINNKSKEWHGSEIGILWHIEHGKKSWANRIENNLICLDCNAEFKSFRPDAKFCCNKCWQRYRRRKNK